MVATYRKRPDRKSLMVVVDLLAAQLLEKKSLTPEKALHIQRRLEKSCPGLERPGLQHQRRLEKSCPPLLNAIMIKSGKPNPIKPILPPKGT